MAELEARRNPMLAAIVARENTTGAGSRQEPPAPARARRGQPAGHCGGRHRHPGSGANKAKVKAETARQNIDNMALKAKRPAMSTSSRTPTCNFMYCGMQLPALQVGDTVRAGMAVAQIPDLKNWEVSANIGELDRGHLVRGQKVRWPSWRCRASHFTGHVKEIGGTAGAVLGSPLRLQNRARRTRRRICARA